ncbi:extracellular solute-binding protein [Paenibacillus motobuensis]|uniref:ABC transporter substrate-binding protein n=1 Tax=Paenibacillus TaxID=44249 RepID=UPI0020402F76|nr:MULTISPECIES: extracellular solute-binding protein [Paenibacillus]MCM3042552.1 extracellular solute-binding protein [Paenibacillus lutimineralis]MCM3649656.1 extracellular solute-binding protein [Paenibacillus motobuensis]
MNRWLQVLTVLIVSCLLVVGCKSESKSPIESKKNQETTTLKVIYHQDSELFYKQYGDLFTTLNNQIQFELISDADIYKDMGDKTKEEVYADFIREEQPDILILNAHQFKNQINDGILTELDSLSTRDNYNLDGFVPGLVDQFRELGGGGLYGLTPSFSSKAIFYNKDLFKKNDIELPSDGMSWYDIIDLARRFPTEGDKQTRVYGYSGGEVYEAPMDLVTLIDKMSQAEGLAIVNTDKMQVTIDTDAWKKVIQTAIKADQSGAIFNSMDELFTSGTNKEFYDSQQFLMGRSAMHIGSVTSLALMDHFKNDMNDYIPFELGIAAGPVDPLDPTSTYVTPGDIFAINIASVNQDAAWEFIKYVCGEDYARASSKSNELLLGQQLLLSRSGFMTDYEGTSLEPFYQLRSKLLRRSDDWYKLPDQFFNDFATILSRELELVEKGQKSLDEAIATVRSEAQAVLDQAVNEMQHK